MSRLRAWATGSRLRIVLLAIVALFLVIQLVPYGRDHSNPPVTQAASFDDPRTAQLVDDACGACHSNMTNWPLEAGIAPTSWLIQHDVEDARRILNFSEWDRPQPELERVLEAISGGEMPPLQYKVLHPSARLPAAEKDELTQGLSATYASDPPGP